MKAESKSQYKKMYIHKRGQMDKCFKNANALFVLQKRAHSFKL